MSEWARTSAETSIDSPLHVKEQIRRTIVNEEIKRRLARVPAIPSELSREQEKIVSWALPSPV